MKKFIIKFCLKIILPIIIGVIVIIYWDPFKVFFTCDDYYTNNPVTGNREDVCIKLLNKNPNNISNFIIGNSRSLAYKTPYWCKKIQQPNNSVFHYDGSSFGIYRASNAIKFMVKKYKIKNILLIVDTDFFTETKNNKGHLYIQPPSVSNESKFSYYFTFFKASIDFKFIFYNLIYKLTGNYYDFMGNRLIKSKNSHKSDNLTGDLWFAVDQDIKSDSLSYYTNLISKGVFYKRNQKDLSKPLIGVTQMKLLKEINHDIKKNNIDLKIVISPLYNQVVFNDLDKIILANLFGNKNIYDFSGKNDFTEKITNYYEKSHYKPCVANKIMDLIYTSSSKSN
jgi:hypothetical protein